MKIVAVIVLLAFCGIASATPFKRQDTNFTKCDITDLSILPDILSRCGTSTAADAKTCSDNCSGYICKEQQFSKLMSITAS